jgi:hypothetical protein
MFPDLVIIYIWQDDVLASPILSRIALLPRQCVGLLSEVSPPTVVDGRSLTSLPNSAAGREDDVQVPVPECSLPVRGSQTISSSNNGMCFEQIFNSPDQRRRCYYDEVVVIQEAGRRVLRCLHSEGTSKWQCWAELSSRDRRFAQE